MNNAASVLSSFSLSLIMSLGEIKLPCCEQPYEEAHVVRHQDPPAGSHVSEPGSKSSCPVVPSDDLPPGQDLECSLMKDLEPELANQAAPMLLTLRNFVKE